MASLIAATALAGTVRVEPLTPQERAAKLRRLTADNLRFIGRLLGTLGVAFEDLEDAAQQVFLVFSDRFDDIQPGSERSFLVGTAYRVTADLRRKRKAPRELPHERADLDERGHEGPGPDELTDQKRARQVLDAVLDAMGQELRAVFVLFEIEGLTTPEIAAALNVPIGTAASRLRRAREQFRELVAARTAEGGEA